MPTMQIDKTALREYLLEELPVIFEENYEIQQSIARIFEQQNLRELVEAQKTSAQQLTRLEIAITELAEAQKRTEQGITELVDAQKHTEQRLDHVEDRLTRIEKTFAELVEVQKRNEEELSKLIKTNKDTRKQLAGLGYSLEDKAFPALPHLLQRDFGMIVQGRLKRTYVKDKFGMDIEVNIVGKAVKEGKEVIVIGESKSQLSKNDVEAFIRKKLHRLQGVFPEIFPLLVTYMISSPDVEDFVKGQGIALYYSYDF
jgi:hypothetical protein